MSVSNLVGDIVLFSVDDKLKEHILKALGESPITPVTTTKTTIKIPSSRKSSGSNNNNVGGHHANPKPTSMEFTKIKTPLFTKLKTHTYVATKNFRDISIGRILFHRKSFHANLCDTLIGYCQNQQEENSSLETPRTELKFLKESISNNMVLESVINSHIIHFPHTPIFPPTQHRNLNDHNSAEEVSSSPEKEDLAKSASPTPKSNYHGDLDKKIRMSSITAARRGRSLSTNTRPTSSVTSLSLPNFDKAKMNSGSNNNNNNNNTSESPNKSKDVHPDKKNTTNISPATSPPLSPTKEQKQIDSYDSTSLMFCENLTLNKILEGIHIKYNSSSLDQNNYTYAENLDYKMSISETESAKKPKDENKFPKKSSASVGGDGLTKAPKIAGYLSFNFLLKKYLHFLESNNDVYFWEYVLSLIKIGLSLDDAMNYCHFYTLSDFKEMGPKVFNNGDGSSSKKINLNICTSIYDIGSVNRVHLGIHVLNNKNTKFTGYILDFKTQKPHDWLYTMYSARSTHPSSGNVSPHYLNDAGSDNDEYDIDDDVFYDEADECEDLKSPIHNGYISTTDDDSSMGDPSDNVLYGNGGDSSIYSVDWGKYISNEIHKMRPKKPVCYVLCMDLHNIKELNSLKDYMEMINYWQACDILPPEILSYIIRVNEKLKKRKKHSESQSIRKFKELDILHDNILLEIKKAFFNQNKTFVVILGHSQQSFAIHQISEKIDSLRKTGITVGNEKLLHEHSNKDNSTKVSIESIDVAEEMTEIALSPSPSSDLPSKSTTTTTTTTTTTSIHTSTTSSSEEVVNIDTSKPKIVDNASTNPLHHGLLEAHIKQILELSKEVLGIGHFAFMNIDCTQPIQVNMTFQKIASIIVRQFGGVSARDGYSSSSSGSMYGKNNPSGNLMAILQHIYLNS